MSNLTKRAATIVKRTASSAAVPLHHPDIQAPKFLPDIQELPSTVKPYSKIPGPWGGIPFIGNSWRFAPFIGNDNKKKE